jgi:pimeloyl-ACP methyl ester carboxylesterase
MNSAPSDFKDPTGSPQPSSGYSNPTKSPFGGLYNDPRSSSTQSLTPSLPEYEEVERRKLLVIYVHGFMGNDTSFQSFPAHVHRYLKLALSDSHVVHSKVYPRYKTYKSIEIARDNFSTWLEPLESPKTDVILVGHSMGGLLAADVVLKASSLMHPIKPSLATNI